MLAQVSPYARAAGKLRDNGYNPMPIIPGAKWPGKLQNGAWYNMPAWQQWCDKQPPEFLHDKWEEWPDAGVGVAHGALCGLDIDTDRKAVADAAIEAVGPSPVRRVGKKGWMGYYRTGAAGDGYTARVRWYDPEIFTVRPDGRKDYPPQVEILFHGTQSVVPPTIHPTTGQPYRWITEDTLEDTPLEDLPELPFDAVERLTAAFAKIGLVDEIPGQQVEYEKLHSNPDAPDAEKPFWRALNDRAMAAIDDWWPALNMPKSRQRGPGAWEAVPFWRSSNGGRAESDRNPNLKATTAGIRDFGAERRFTPLTLVMEARMCDLFAAKEWLEQFVPPENYEPMNLDAMLARFLAADADQTDEIADAPSGVEWASKRSFDRQARPRSAPAPVPSQAEFSALMEPGAFPVPPSALRGLFRETALYIEEASVVWTEAGAIAAALPLLGSLMGRAWASQSNLRTNFYTVAIGPSGSGKTSLVAPARELLIKAGANGMVGPSEFPSGTGLLKALEGASGPMMSFLDEFGHMLQQLGSPGAGTHAKQVVSNLTKLFSAANGTFDGIAYAGGKTDPLVEPHLCIFAQSTPEQFWNAFSSGSIADGSAARFLVMPLGETQDQEADRSFGDELVANLKDLIAARGDSRGAYGGNLRPAAVSVPMNDKAEALRAALKRTEIAFARYCDENSVRGGAEILRRVTEQAVKISLVSAVGRNPREPVIDTEDFEVGHAIAWWSAASMVENISANIADNQVERDVNTIEQKIRKAGAKGIMAGTLKDQVRAIRKRDFEEAIESLAAAGKVDIEIVKVKKPGKLLRHRDFQ